MPTLTDVTNILPNPNNAYNVAGQDSGNDKGPGFVSVKLTSEHKINNQRTNSGRLVSRELSGHKWNIDITYNPLTRDEFDPVYSFLLQSRGSMKPFFVSLPQYSTPKDSTFASYGDVNAFSPTALTAAGNTNMLIEESGYSVGTHGSPKPGDIFTVSDNGHDSNHTKVYQITRVETSADHTDALGATDRLRLHFIPALQRSVSAGANIIFSNPLFRVVLRNDVQEQSLGVNNLYQFSLKVEEAQK